MSKRLQIVVTESDLRLYEQAAKAQRVSLSEWARQAMRAAERELAQGDVDSKLAAVEGAVNYNFPAPDIDQMLKEIGTSYQQDLGT